MNLYILPYKTGSRSASALAEATGARRIRRGNSRFVPSESKLVVNWGCSRVNAPVVLRDTVENILNKPSQVSIASNKLRSFEAMAQNGAINIPDFTTDEHVAAAWLNLGDLVVGRQELSASGGAGIVLMEPLDHERQGGDIRGIVTRLPLYTRYIKKRDEYRVHVFRGEVIAVQRKARRLDVPDPEVNWRIRNNAFGFTFARNEERELPEDLLQQALLAVEQLGLDFGAVDLIYNSHRNTSYVLEVNTACGLEGTTVQDYANAINRYRMELEQ